MYKFRTTDFLLNKDLSVVLQQIYGLGLYKANFIIARLGLSFPFFTNNLNDYYCFLLFFFLNRWVLTQPRITRFINLRIKRMIDLKTYKGARHKLCLPVRGQRTRTNANTQRSKRKLLK